MKKSPKVEGSNTKAKSAKPIIMIKNIERSLIFDKTAIRRLFNFGLRIYNLAFNIATHLILISLVKKGFKNVLYKSVYFYRSSSTIFTNTSSILALLTFMIFISKFSMLTISFSLGILSV